MLYFTPSYRPWSRWPLQRRAKAQCPQTKKDKRLCVLLWVVCGTLPFRRGAAPVWRCAGAIVQLSIFGQTNRIARCLVSVPFYAPVKLQPRCGKHFLGSIAIVMERTAPPRLLEPLRERAEYMPMWLCTNSKRMLIPSLRASSLLPLEGTPTHRRSVSQRLLIRQESKVSI